MEFQLVALAFGSGWKFCRRRAGLALPTAIAAGRARHQQIATAFNVGTAAPMFSRLRRQFLWFVTLELHLDLFIHQNKRLHRTVMLNAFDNEACAST